MSEISKIKLMYGIINLSIYDNKELTTSISIKNAIHAENMSVAIARSLSRRTLGPIEKMAFGNGGSTVNGLNTITYQIPNVTGSSATLYNQTYEKIVDDLNVNNVDPTLNKMVVSHINGNLYSDLSVVCTLDYGEPSGQELLDNSTNTEGLYIFDEIGLKDYDGKLITHAIFHPIQKSQNRLIEVKYDLRIQII